MNRRRQRNPRQRQQRDHQMKPLLDFARLGQLQQPPIGQFPQAAEIIPQMDQIKGADRDNTKQIGPSFAFVLLPPLGDVPRLVGDLGFDRLLVIGACSWVISPVDCAIRFYPHLQQYTGASRWPSPSVNIPLWQASLASSIDRQATASLLEVRHGYAYARRLPQLWALHGPDGC